VRRQLVTLLSSMMLGLNYLNTCTCT